MTPLDVARKRGHVQIEEFLRGAGMSHVSALLVADQSWIEIYCEFDHFTVFEVLQCLTFFKGGAAWMHGRMNI